MRRIEHINQIERAKSKLSNLEEQPSYDMADIKQPRNSASIQWHGLNIILLYENSKFHSCCVFIIR